MSPLAAWQGKTWALVFGGWTLFGLCSFAACLLADAASGEDFVPWTRILGYSLGAAWIWAALTPAVLWAAELLEGYDRSGRRGEEQIGSGMLVGIPEVRDRRYELRIVRSCVGVA